MRKSDFILGVFAILIVFSLIVKGVHIAISGNAPSCLKISKK